MSMKPVARNADGWQLALNSQKECFKYLLENEELADIHFLFKKEDKRIPAHKFLLATRSQVFQAQFYGDLPAGSRGNSHEVEIEDIELAAFVEMLR